MFFLLKKYFGVILLSLIVSSSSLVFGSQPMPGIPGGGDSWRGLLGDIVGVFKDYRTHDPKSPYGQPNPNNPYPPNPNQPNPYPPAPGQISSSIPPYGQPNSNNPYPPNPNQPNPYPLAPGQISSSIPPYGQPNPNNPYPPNPNQPNPYPPTPGQISPLPSPYPGSPFPRDERYPDFANLGKGLPPSGVPYGGSLDTLSPYPGMGPLGGNQRRSYPEFGNLGRGDFPGSPYGHPMPPSSYPGMPPLRENQGRPYPEFGTLGRGDFPGSSYNQYPYPADFGKDFKFDPYTGRPLHPGERFNPMNSERTRHSGDHLSRERSFRDSHSEFDSRQSPYGFPPSSSE